MDMEAYVMPNAVIDDATPLEAFMVCALDVVDAFTQSVRNPIQFG